MFLARKISLAKWSKKQEQGELAEDEIPADAVTADLRTQDNKLSFWRCGDGEGDRSQRGRTGTSCRGQSRR